jgi:hypothetical protein
MEETPPTFRDFGIHPEGLKPPAAARIRSYLSTGPIVGQYIFTGIVAVLGLGLAVAFVLTLPLALAVLGAAAALIGFAAIIHLATHNDYRWIELDGNTLRARHLYFGRTVERSLEEIDCLGTMVYQVRTDTTDMMELLLGRVKGVEIRFRDLRTPLRIVRADPAMTNAAELIEAVLYRMQQLRPLQSEIVNWEGKPLVRRVFWQGDEPRTPPGKVLKLCLGLVIFFAVLFGMVCAFVWLKVHEQYAVGSQPPHEMTLRTLIEQGPGSNRHVTITDFEGGGHVMESEEKRWKMVWVALFPRGTPPQERKEIKAVVWSDRIGNEAQLRVWLRQDRITGICSATPRSKFGTSLGPMLVDANPGSTLTAAWSIDELTQRPSSAEVTGTLNGAIGCFAAVLLAALIVFWLK